MIHLSLPLPPSKNRLYANAKRWTRDKAGRKKSYTGRQKSKRYLAFESAAGWAVLQQTTPQQREALQHFAAERPLSLVAYVRFPADGQDHDTANITDALLDAIKGPLGVDDERFWRVTVERVESGPPCEVVIEEV